MLRIVEIFVPESFKITCKCNDGSVWQLDLLPVLQQENNPEGVKKLENLRFLQKVQIGECGELVWKKIVKNKLENGKTKLWDYDISPEYFFHHAQKLT